MGVVLESLSSDRGKGPSPVLAVFLLRAAEESSAGKLGNAGKLGTLSGHGEDLCYSTADHF